jgi:hypothetical protein
LGRIGGAVEEDDFNGALARLVNVLVPGIYVFFQ